MASNGRPQLEIPVQFMWSGYHSGTIEVDSGI